jgi:AraC family transcriptional regulator
MGMGIYKEIKMISPDIKNITSKKLIGRHITMSLADNKTFALFSSFMPKRFEIKNTVSPDIFCLKTYPRDYFTNFSPSTTFEKWALMEVNDHNLIPEGMESFNLPGGLYAVFHYKGLNTDFSIFEYIFREWLPDSEYLLDNRPHFDIMGAGYKNNDPESEEDLYIPIKKK